MWYDNPMLEIERGDIIRTSRGVAEIKEVRNDGVMIVMWDRPDHITYEGFVAKRDAVFWNELTNGELIDSL